MTVSQADGSFKLPDIPHGSHRLVIWHESKGYLVRRKLIEVSGDEFKHDTVKVRLTPDDREWLGLDDTSP